MRIYFLQILIKRTDIIRHLKSIYKLYQSKKSKPVGLLQIGCISASAAHDNYRDATFASFVLLLALVTNPR